MKNTALTSNNSYKIESGKFASIWGSTKPSKLVNLCNQTAHFFSHVQPQSASVGKKWGALPSFSFTQVFLFSFVFSHLPFSLKFSIFIFLYLFRRLSLTPHFNAISFLFPSPCIFSLIPHLLLLSPTLTLGIEAKVELKSSIPIGAITEISPTGFTIGVQAEKETIFLIHHFFALTWTQGRKRILSSWWGGQFATLGAQCCCNKIFLF